MPRTPSPPRSRAPIAPGVLLDRARSWMNARVTFDRVTDVNDRCPHCAGLVTRRLGPGVICGTCGRLWVVREMLDREIHVEGSIEGAA
jgi:hypothetical protein